MGKRRKERRRGKGRRVGEEEGEEGKEVGISAKEREEKVHKRTDKRGWEIRDKEEGGRGLEGG